jgi:hypothetical protein
MFGDEKRTTRRKRRDILTIGEQNDDAENKKQENIKKRLTP